MSSCQLQTLPTLAHPASTLAALIKTMCLIPGRKWLGLGNRHTEKTINLRTLLRIGLTGSDIANPCISDCRKRFRVWSCHIVTKRWGRAQEIFTLLKSVESGRCHCFWMEQNSEPYKHLVRTYRQTMMWSKFKVTLFNVKDRVTDVARIRVIPLYHFAAHSKVRSLYLCSLWWGKHKNLLCWSVA